MLIKKISILAVAASILITSGVADAGINWGQVIGGVVKNKIENAKTNHVTVKKNMVIDGNYNSGSCDGSKINNGDIPIVVYSTRVEEPVTVNWHFIGNGEAFFDFQFKDSNGQELVYERVYKNATQDAFVVLEPGDYELLVYCGGNGVGSYRFKGTKKIVNTNVSSDLSFVDDAGYLSNGITAINYFASTRYRKDRFHYYTFSVPYSRNVSVVGIPYVNCIVDFDILDADQVVVDYFRVYNAESRRKNLYLKSGKYYIRAGVNDNKGGVYGVKVE